MTHQVRIPRRQELQLQALYAECYAGSLEYNDQHLAMLRKRRDSYLNSLKA
jgi:hypothetical protein